MKKLTIIVAAICLIFGAVVLNRGMNTADAKSGEQLQAGDIILYGEYPQTLVTDAKLLAMFDEKIADDDRMKWSSIPVYLLASSNDPDVNSTRAYEDYIKTKKVQYAGNDYQAVYINKSIPQDCRASRGSAGESSQGSVYQVGKTYYFKIEPLEWIVLNPSTGLCVSRYGIDAKPFRENLSTDSHTGAFLGDENKLQDYFRASVRGYLADENVNGNSKLVSQFVRKAFAFGRWDDGLVAKTYTGLDGKSYTDKVTLMTESQFNSYIGNKTLGPMLEEAINTDYACAMGAAEKENAHWFLRSESVKTSGGRVTYAYGATASNSQSPYNTIEKRGCSIRPVIYVNVKSENVIKKKDLPRFSVSKTTEEQKEGNEHQNPVVFWKPVEGATSYTLLRHVSDNTPYDKTHASWEEVTATNVGSTIREIYELSDRNAEPNVLYQYAVRVTTPWGRIESDDYVLIRGRYEKPVVTGSYDMEKGEIVLRWKAIPGVRFYEVYRRDIYGKFNPYASIYVNGSTKEDWEYRFPVESVPKEYMFRVGSCGLSLDDSANSVISAGELTNQYFVETIDQKFDTLGGVPETGFSYFIDRQRGGTVPKLTVTRRGYYFLGWSHDKFATSADFKSGSAFTYTGQDFYAVWQTRNYKITYNLDGGKNNSANPSKYTVESPAIYLKPATKAGYRFDGWYTDAAMTKKSSGIAPDSIGDRTFYAKFTKMADVKLSFSRNGGSGNAPAAQTVKYGTVVTIPSIFPTREGYYYLGWSKDKNATEGQYKAGDKITMTENTVLHAVWKPRTNTITFDANGGSGTLPATIKVLTGKTAVIGSSSMSRSGYWFLGWSTSSTATTGTYKTGSEISVSKDTVLYAVWKKK